MSKVYVYELKFLKSNHNHFILRVNKFSRDLLFHANIIINISVIIQLLHDAHYDCVINVNNFLI